MLVTTLLLTAAAIGAVNVATARAEGRSPRQPTAARSTKQPLVAPPKLHGRRTRGEVTGEASVKPAARPATKSAAAKTATGPLVRAVVASADDHDPDEDGPDEPGPRSGSGSGVSRGTGAGGAPAGAGLPPDPVGVARASMEQLARNLQHVQRVAAKADRDTYTVDCLAEKIGEARVGLQIGEEEMTRLHDGLARGDVGEQAYAVRRLQLLVERAKTVLDGARICAAKDPGGITATRVEVEVAPTVPAGDPTAPAPFFQPVERPPEQ